jgi:hypothetical protein
MTGAAEEPEWIFRHHPIFHGGIGRQSVAIELFDAFSDIRHGGIFSER